MRCAIITVTHNGARLAENLRRSIGCETDIYGKRNSFDKSLPVTLFEKMSDIAGLIFQRYDAVIFFCAVGIAVRMTAPYIIRKDKDPAVVVVDEQGRFAVSLLSGHLGGANELTEKVARLLGAVPVITTATDINGMTAPDMVARKLGFCVSPLENVKILNAALLKGEQIAYYISSELPRARQYKDMLEKENIAAAVVSRREIGTVRGPAVLVTDKPIEDDKFLCFIRRRLTAGIGCRRGTSREDIEVCLRQACHMADCDVADIVLISSAWVKADEQGILRTADKYAVPVKFWDSAALQRTILKYGLKESPFVKEQIGVGNVCEAAALAGRADRLILGKTKFEKVTVALAWEK